MANTAELIQTLEVDALEEEHLHSLSTLRRLGKSAVQGAFSETYLAYRELAFEDFTSHLAEMLKTDPDFRKYLEVESKPRVYDVFNSRVCAADGTPMTELVERGLINSRQAAERDHDLYPQVLRSEGDLVVAEAVDKLRPGESLFALSMDPKKELGQDRKKWEAMGYREGIAYFQMYCRVSDTQLYARAYSIDQSDETHWKSVFAELDVQLPDDVSPNTWIQHTIKKTMSLDEAENFVSLIKQSYYQAAGINGKHISANKYIESHQKFLNTAFNNYYLKLAQATITHENQPSLQKLAYSILQNTDTSTMKPELRRQLVLTANSDSFSDSQSRAMETFIRYAVIEELRKGLEPLKQTEAHASSLQALSMPANITAGASEYEMNLVIAQNIDNGIKAQRSYGGCNGTDLASSNKRDEQTQNQQDVFGGNSNGSESSSQTCTYTHSNCYCCPYNEDGTPRASKLKVMAKRDVNGTAYCLRRGCNASIKSDGSGDIGFIAKRAKMLSRQKA